MTTTTKLFTKKEIINITTRNIMESFQATNKQANNPQTSLQYDLNITSFGLLDWLINTWEDLQLDFKTIPAVQVHTVGDLRNLALDAVKLRKKMARCK